MDSPPFMCLVVITIKIDVFHRISTAVAGETNTPGLLSFTPTRRCWGKVVLAWCGYLVNCSAPQDRIEHRLPVP